MSTFITAIRLWKAAAITVTVSDHRMKQKMDVINLSLA